MRRVRWVAVVIAAWLCPAAHAFKDHDFQTECAKVAFCSRLRGVQQPSYTVQPSSVRFSKDSLSATLKTPEAGKDFSLQLSAYDGILRVRVLEPGNQRYEVQDVLMPKLPTASLQRSDKSDSQASLKLGDQTVVLRYSPFQIEVPGVLMLNDRSLFGIEHKRHKTDDDPEGWWEETFKTHTDSKPRGPQAISFDLTFTGAAHVYGLPEHAAPLSLPPTTGMHPATGAAVQSEPYRLYNLDVFEYLADSPFGLYGAIPFLTAHSAQRTVGAFWLNAAEMYVDIAKHKGNTQTQWISESGVLDLFLLLGPSPAGVQGQYAALTGTTAMPPMFSLGYHQCRWNYNDEADVKQVNAGFDTHAMPCDVIWLDIEHTVGKQYMTWDKSKFPHPKEMIDGVASFGRKMVCIVDPHVKRDESYPLYKEANKKGYYIRNKDGKPFDGWCWPGSSSYLDVMSPEIRKWWGQQLALDKYAGSTEDLHIWNDMNEPSVFNGPEITMPKDALHFGPNGDAEHRDVHNVYGTMYHLATAEGLRMRGPVAGRPSQRPFVLSRAFFAGTQRVGPIWTGDNMATWEHLKLAAPMLLSISIAGLPNCGADVGGFFGDPSPELLVRWYQSAALYPFFRGHAHLDSARREPWLFGEPYTSQIRAALRERYALLPYLYTLFQAANATNTPIMRPLWYDFPQQEHLFDAQTAFMLGPAMLSAPVLDEGAESVLVPFPRGERWFDAATGTEVPAHDGSVQIPVNAESMPRYYRGGHIIARRNRARRSTRAQAHDPYTIIVALDSAQQAAGQLYIDDGVSYDFLSGKYVDVKVSFADGVLAWAPHHAGAHFDSIVESVVVIGHEGAHSGNGRFAFSIDGDTASGEVARGSETVGMFGGDVLVLRGPRKPVSTAWSLTLQTQ